MRLPRPPSPDNTSLHTLHALRALELSPIHPFKPHHQEQKHHLLQILHTTHFFTTDDKGYPIAIPVPQRYAAQVGFTHLFYAEDWAGLAAPRGLRGVRWPPEDVEGLLKADGREGCLGCEIKGKSEGDEMMRGNAVGLEKGDVVDVLCKDGVRRRGQVVRNVRVREIVVVVEGEAGGESVESEVPWGALCWPEGESGTAEDLSTTASASGDVQRPTSTDERGKTTRGGETDMCACDIDRWHKFLQSWHKRFELRPIPSTSTPTPDTPSSAPRAPIIIPQLVLTIPSSPSQLLSSPDSSTNPNPPQGTASAPIVIPDPSPAIDPDPEPDPGFPTHAPSTPIAVIAKTYIPPNRPIGEFIGVLKPNLALYPETDKEVRERTISPPPRTSVAEQMKHCVEIRIGTSSFPLSDEMIDDEAPTARIDNFAYGNFTRFIRHSCAPNVERRTVRFGPRRMMVYFTLRGISAGEEVVEDFGDVYVREVGACGCGAKECRRRRKGKERAG